MGFVVLSSMGGAIVLADELVIKKHRHDLHGWAFAGFTVGVYLVTIIIWCFCLGFSVAFWTCTRQCLAEMSEERRNRRKRIPAEEVIIITQNVSVRNDYGSVN
jgi:hypothetical protein